MERKLEKLRVGFGMCERRYWMRGRKEDIGKGMDEKGCNEWIWEIVNIHL